MDSLPVKVPTETVTAHQKYLFHHVMKCGGTSMRHVFEGIWGSSRVLWATDGNVDRPPMYFARYALIGGHFQHLFGSYFHADRQYITMVRNPIDRTMSHYYYFKNNVPTQNISIVVKKTQALSFKELVNSEDPELLSYFFDHQAKAFAYLDPSVCNLTKNELLNKAKEHLRRFAFVGIYENFPDSVDFCCLRFGFSPVVNIPRENVTKDRKFSSDLSQELVKKLTALNEVDLEFYEFAKSLFSRQKRSLLLELIDQNKKFGAAEAQAVIPDTDDGHSNDNFVDCKQTVPDAWGDLAVEIIGVFLSGAHSGVNVLNVGEEVVLKIFIKSHGFVGNITAGFMIKDPIGTVIYGTNSYYLGTEIFVEVNKGYCIQFQFPADIRPGDYFIAPALHTGSAHNERCFHWWEKAASFRVADCLEPMFVGQVRLPSSVRANEIFLEDPFRAELEPLKDIEVLGVLEEIEIPVRVKNTSAAVWLTTGDNPVNLAYHWIDAEGEVVVYDGIRTSFERPVLPGDELILSARIHGPAQAGRFVLQLTLVQEWVAWFEQRGVETLDFHVLVEPTEYKAHQPQMTSS